jgi:hypothetical protein
MSDFLSKFDGPLLIALVAVGGGILCGIVAIIGGIASSTWQKARNITLKQDMLNRGMSAEEIQTVIEAGSNNPLKALRAEFCDHD